MASADDLAERIAAFLDRHRYILLAAWSIWFAVPAAMRAAAKPFWHDEIYTLLLARLPSIFVHWSALRDGVDSAPPLNGFATRAVRHLAGTGPVAARLPAMIGFWTMAMVIFAVVRERAGAVLGFAAICLPVFTAAYRYSYEARPYGLMMGLASLAWFAWMRSTAGRRRGVFLTLMGVSLAAGLWNHYYAALVYLPIAAGELARVIRERRLDGTLWSVAAVSLVAALPLAPLVRMVARRTAHFWVAPSLADVPATYVFLFQGLVDALAWPVAAVAVIAVWERFRGRRSAVGATRIEGREIAALAACLLIPVAGVLLALLVTGGFVPRYGLPAVFGAAVGLPLAIDRLAYRARWTGVALLLVAGYPFIQSNSPFVRVPAAENPVAARPLLAQSLGEPGRTVISGELMFLQLWYYAPAAQRTQLVYLADPGTALRYRGSEIVDLNYLALARWTPVPVERFDSFVGIHDAFRVYSAGSGWQLDGLRDVGVTLDLAGSESGGRLFYARRDR
jgi:hypothetical protein